MIASVLAAGSRRSPAITFLAVFAYILTGCSTPYQANSLMGGYSDYLVAPDEAIVTFYGNGYTSAMQVIQMTARRCAEVTLQHGYRILWEQQLPMPAAIIPSRPLDMPAPTDTEALSVTETLLAVTLVQAR
jgi:hypothetical protein